ncbi:MAG: DUF4058 family protein [Verrucomicrobia bacterium]|nr:DUF4058 family protein [Verrucomicrobiota bacterium]
MNPYFQESRSNVHTRLISYIGDALAGELPADLTARAEERVVVEAGEEEGRSYRADVAVVEPWRAGFPPLMNFGENGDESSGGSAVAVAEPLLFMAEAVPERWIEVRNAQGSLITVIEVLSPANKTEPGAHAYLRRRQHFLAAGVHLVEIDLVRGGSHVVAIERELLAPKLPPAGTCHLVCVARAVGDGLMRREVYLCPLREPLPAIRVPLRRGDPDVPLALQPLVDRCYRTGRYWLANYQRELQPPAADAEEAAWIAGRVRAAGLVD